MSMLWENIHYATEVYPNRHGPICPICVSRVHFSYVNTLKTQQNYKKMATLARTGKSDGNCASRVRKSAKF